MELKTSPKADLERRKFIFLEIGLILSLAICYIAFEWKSEELSASSLGELTSQDMFEEEMINTQQETPPEQPEPEQPEPEAVIEELIVVDDDKVVENLNIDSEADEKTKTNFNIVQTTFNAETEEEVEPISFAVVEEKPTFPGGEAELLKFIAENTKYPEIA
ncbi:MAG: energy transducer TonB, partial [Bacteroidales bacterium]